MKKLFVTITLILVSTTGSNALAEDNLKIYDNGASLNLASINNGNLELAANSTGASKRSMLAQDDSTSSRTMGNETELGFSYDHPINEKFNTNIKFSYRNDANNNLGASDGAAMLRFNYKLN